MDRRGDLRFEHAYRWLPDSRHVVVAEHGIVCDDWDVFNLCLGGNHAIEWVAVGSRQSPGPLRVEDRDVDTLKSLTSDAAPDIYSNVKTSVSE